MSTDRFSPADDRHYANHRDHVRYQYSDDRLPLAINAALATSRPLLIRGEPGTGKSSVARDVAYALGWDYLEQVVSSRMTADNLLWRFDAIRRLNDAQAGGQLKPVEAYVTPQPLWQLLRPTSAALLAASSDDVERGAVLLLDEIDKADPDVPNDLLVVLGEARFAVTDLDRPLELGPLRSKRLIIITTNGERELPAAFLRRCICLQLETPGKPALRKIAVAHMPELQHSPFLDGWLERMLAIREACTSQQHRPGTAEILDAIAACHELGVNGPDHPHWIALTLATGWKNLELPPPSLVSQSAKQS